MSEEKKQQIIALGKLGWSLRRIERTVHIRRVIADASATDHSDPTMPEWVKPASAKQPAVKKRKRRTAAQRKAHGERMKAYWAARKASQAKASKVKTKAR